MFVAGWRHALRSEWPFIIIINSVFWLQYGKHSHIANKKSRPPLLFPELQQVMRLMLQRQLCGLGGTQAHQLHHGLLMVSCGTVKDGGLKIAAYKR